MSKVLRYFTKDESGKPKVEIFYPSDQEIEHLKEVLLAESPPSKIEWRDNILFTRYIEIVDEAQLVDRVLKKRLDPNDPADKEEIRLFERTIEAFFQTHPPEKRTLEHYAIAEGAIAFTGDPRIAQSGKQRFDTCRMSIKQPLRFVEIYQRWSGLQHLKFLRGRAKAHEQREKVEVIEQKYLSENHATEDQVRDPL